MTARTAALGIALLVVLGGCAGAPGTGSETPGPTDTLTPERTTTAPTAPETPDGTPTPTAEEGTPTPAASGENTTVEYVVRAGDLPAEVAAANVTLGVAFADTSIYNCDGVSPSDASGSFSTPTQTPDLDRDLDCLRYGGLSLDLADLNGSRSLGSYAVPASAVAEYSLVVRDVTVTLENGTVVDDVYAEAFRAHTARDARSRAVGVEIDIDRRAADATPRPNSRAHPDSSYETGSSEFDPAAGEAPVRYRLSTGGSVADGELAVRVTRDAAPANVTLTTVGAAEPRYRTGPDGLVTLDIVDPEIVEIEATVAGRTA
ncbi:hypothetical protein [Halosimplex pelagicum]|uniref:DUF4382 domain-containing protein n=1 Tax=Halosimplex pelagicum TaxID=869886 RepID=A0A7D5P914_9EURY|nr:hypothetical protein [Halosimplex pelagicum]QLH81784.1 hypothetical protein HZS54_09165 [Halosimplex pelagicum]